MERLRAMNVSLPTQGQQSVIIVQNQVIDTDRHICTCCCCCKCCHVKVACIFLMVMELLFSLPEGLGGYLLTGVEVENNGSGSTWIIIGLVLLGKQAGVILAMLAVCLAICCTRSCLVIFYIIIHGIYILIASAILVVLACMLFGVMNVPVEAKAVFAVEDVVEKLDMSGAASSMMNPLHVAKKAYESVKYMLMLGCAICGIYILLQIWVISKFAQLMRYLDERRKEKRQMQIELINGGQPQQQPVSFGGDTGGNAYAPQPGYAGYAPLGGASGPIAGQTGTVTTISNFSNAGGTAPEIASADVPMLNGVQTNVALLDASQRELLIPT